MEASEPVESLINSHEPNISEPERWASLAAGIALALYGLSRRSPGGVLLALLAGGLIYRGATKHSFIYEALGINTAELEEEEEDEAGYVYDDDAGDF